MYAPKCPLCTLCTSDVRNIFVWMFSARTPSACRLPPVQSEKPLAPEPEMRFNCEITNPAYHRSAMDQVVADEVDRVLVTLGKLCQIDALTHKDICLRKCLCVMKSSECFQSARGAMRVTTAAYPSRET